jgi:hypothetical protein
VKLTSLLLENIRGITDGQWTIPEDRWVVTGRRASGKTTVLEAIVALKESVGSYGPRRDPRALLRPGASSGRVEGTWSLSDEEMQSAKTEQRSFTTTLHLGEGARPTLHDPGLRRVLARYDHDPAHGKVEYFPAARGLAARDGLPLPAVDDEARWRLGGDGDKYRGVIPGLVSMALEDGARAAEAVKARGVLLRHEQPDSLAPVKAAIASLLPGCRLIGAEPVGGRLTLVFLRADGTRVGAMDLSAAEQQALLFAGTFARLGLSRSMVLVDMPELHQHPEDHAAFLDGIVAMGTDNQVIVATSSAAIVAATPARAVMRLHSGGAR